MFSPRDALSLALDVAREGMELGEMPIGAVVFDDDRVLGRAYTQERALGRRVVHADLQAILQADEALGFTRASGELTLAVKSRTMPDVHGCRDHTRRVPGVVR